VEPTREPALDTAPDEEHLAPLRSLAVEHDGGREDRLRGRGCGRQAGIGVTHGTVVVEPIPAGARARLPWRRRAGRGLGVLALERIRMRS
jgi:hypothetical protein